MEISKFQEVSEMSKDTVGISDYDQIPEIPKGTR